MNRRSDERPFQYLHDEVDKLKVLTATDVREAVAQGMREAVADPDFWSAAYSAMQQRAQQEAGGWLLGGLKAAAARVGWLVLAFASIYMLGGWAGLLAFIKTGAVK